MIYFSEFNGNIANLAIVDQKTMETAKVYNVDFEGIQEATAGLSISTNLRPDGTNIDFSSWFNSSKSIIAKMGGAVLQGVSLGLCGLSIEAAVVSGGLLTAVAVLNCGSFVSSFVASKVEDKGVAVVIKSGAGVGKYAETVLKCAALNKVECLKAVGGGMIALGGVFSYAHKAEVNIEVSEALALFQKTSGLAGKWIQPLVVKVRYDTITSESPSGDISYAYINDIDSSYWVYEFGANNQGSAFNSYKTLDLKSNSSGEYSTSHKQVFTTKYVFTYTVLKENEFKLDYSKRYLTNESIHSVIGRTYKENEYPMDESYTYEYGMSEDYLNLTFGGIELVRE